MSTHHHFDLRTSRRTAALILAISFTSLLIHSARLSAQQFRLTLLDGGQVEGTLVRLSPSGRLEGENLPADLELDGLRSIQRTTAAAKANVEPAVIVELHAGVINASSVSLADEKLAVSWPHGDALSIPIEQVKAIRFDPKTPGDVFDQALAAPSTEHDRLFLKIEDRLQSVTGLVESIADDNVVFEYEGQKRTLACRQLYGIVAAQFEAPDKQPAKCRVTFIDGTRLDGEPAALADGELELKLKGDVAVKMPLAAIERIDVRSSRLQFLSDLDPVEAEEQAVVTFGRPWQRDRSVSGEALSLVVPKTDRQDRTVRRFDKGLGVHARSRLVFETTGFEEFAAVIGIDAETEGRGDCEFVVLADGRELYRQRVRGGEAPRDVKLNIAGAKQITLLVEPGADLDLADHADWCDARLLRLAND
jgi:hypothetical protein